MTSQLQDWLNLLERRHPQAIELGLTRCQTVWHTLGAGRTLPPVITVAGTNGKGTTSAAIAAIAAAHGLRCGLYTSPHLVRYNERVQILGQPATDAQLVESFAAVEQARGSTRLTYFETGTLAALWLFTKIPLDLVVLEVGLGGRLDAVNIIDPAVAVLTSIGLDHQQWLGPDRRTIGLEKAAIARAGKPWVCAETDLPPDVLQSVLALGAQPVLLGQHYHYQLPARDRAAAGADRFSVALLLPAQPAQPLQLFDLPTGGFLAGNLATALQALASWGLTLHAAAVHAGLQALHLPGRQTWLNRQPDILVDVAHNAQAAQALAERLQAEPCQGITYALFGILDDKLLADTLAPLLGLVDRWLVVDLARCTERGAPADAVVAQLLDSGAVAEAVPGSVAQAYKAARTRLQPVDRLVAWGSFHLAGPVLAMHEEA